jgi:predicted 2-oxoglutarate/Fe(II)-dependent dioxygenase YbiX
MFDKVSDYIHVQRGVIGADVCARLMEMIGNARWQPNTWYDQATQQTYSEDSLEPDALFATDEMHQLLGPAVSEAARAYVDRYAYKDSLKTSRIISAFSNVRFNRYVPGQIMRKHHDHIHAIFDGREKGIPVLSFVGNLNEDYEGGELAFFDGQTKFALKTGDICMFPSCFLYPHEVLEVRTGKRYSFAMWAW